LLTGAAAGVAAVGLPRQAAKAATGDPIFLGAINESDEATRIYRPEFGSQTTTVMLNSIDAAVFGITTLNNADGVIGHASGVNGVGVKGSTDGHVSTIGVSGISNPQGIGVKGLTNSGTAVDAEAINIAGHALRVRGRAVFDRSGRAILLRNQAAKTITNQFVGSGAMVLATIQGDIPETWVRGVSLDIANNRFVIRLNRPAPQNLIVGWFIVN
jgi:hypothetical protein